MSKDLPSPSSSQDSDTEGALLQAARTAARLANGLRTAVAALGALSATAGVALWGVVWWPGSTAPLAVMFEGLTLVLVLVPAGILALFHQGLSDLLALPRRIADHSIQTANRSGEAVRTVVGSDQTGLWTRLRDIARQLWSLRSLLLEHRALLVRYGALIRFVNPGFLLLVMTAGAVSLLLIPIALASLMVVFVW